MAKSEPTNWAPLVAGILANDQDALTELYQRFFQRTMRWFILRRLGPQDLDDHVHESYLALVRTMQRGNLSVPDALPMFARVVVYRYTLQVIEQRMEARQQMESLDASGGIREDYLADRSRASNPEQRLIDREMRQIARRALSTLRPCDAEILTRFYCDEQPVEQIRSEMSLTLTQFRLLKSRALHKFARQARGHFASGSLSRLKALAA